MRKTGKAEKTAAPGLSAADLAEIVGGYSSVAIRWRAKRLSLPPDIVLPNGLQFWSPPLAARILAAIQAGQQARRKKVAPSEDRKEPVSAA